MTPEERFDRIERQIEFLAGHQAQMSSAIDHHSEQIGQLGNFLLRTARSVEDLVRRTEERFNQIANWQQRSDRKLEELAEAQRRTDGQIQQLIASQQRTDERLNILVGFVERYFSNGGRGRQ